MSNKALDYAEQTLGVHIQHELATVELEALNDILSDLDKARDEKMKLEDAYADREVELTNEMRGIHPNMSDTRFKSEWKGWERTDDRLRALRLQLMEVRSNLSGLEIDSDMAKARLRVYCSRMEQLGGYLNYLAAVKLAASGAVQQAEQNTNLQETSGT